MQMIVQSSVGLTHQEFHMVTDAVPLAKSGKRQNRKKLQIKEMTFHDVK